MKRGNKMRKITYGELLYRFRIEKGLEAQEICEGLCSTSAMSFFEKEMRVPDTLLFERLVQRMGISPEEFSIMVNKEEYEYYTWRGNVYEAIENANLERLGELLCSRDKTKKYCNQVLENQFFLYADAIYNGMKNEYTEAIRLLGDAAKQTMPAMFELLKRNSLLSSLEIHILMLYIYYGVISKKLEIEEGKKLFVILEYYIYEGKIDLSEKARYYSKLICIGLHLFQGCFKEREQMQFCKKAIDILRENHSFHDITELLHFYIPLLEKRESRETGFYKKQYEVFSELLKSEDLDISFHPEYLNRSKSKIYILNEYFEIKRKEKGVTQEKLSAGICAPETYSRIETGKQTPSRKNVEVLVEELEIDWCFYRGELDTCELKAYELRTLQRAADIEGRRYDSLDILDDLEECLDMESVANYQYITLCRSITKYRLGLLGVEETRKILEELLCLTQKKKKDILPLAYYSQTELEIVAHLAQLLRGQGKYKEGIELCETIIKQMENSRLSYEEQWNGFSFLFRVLGNLYFAIGEYENSMRIANYVKHISIKRRDGASLAGRLDAIADNLEHMGEQFSEEYKKLYRYTYYVADFFKIEKIIDFAKKYYEDNFDKEIVWYENYLLSISSK